MVLDDRVIESCRSGQEAASVDTYLRFAEAVNRLDLTQTEERGIDVLRDVAGSVSGEKAEDALTGAEDTVEDAVERVKETVSS